MKRIRKSYKDSSPFCCKEKKPRKLQREKMTRNAANEKGEGRLRIDRTASQARTFTKMDQAHYGNQCNCLTAHRWFKVTLKTTSTKKRQIISSGEKLQEDCQVATEVLTYRVSTQIWLPAFGIYYRGRC